MPDPIFADPRLARIYDDLDADRRDLDPYAALIASFGAASVLDIGCGTGTFACRLAAEGLAVTGVDPAAASLDVASAKAFAEHVDWRLGTVVSSEGGCADVATMTGNVAQVFPDDDEWNATLTATRGRLRPGGHLVFETRDPSARAWEQWNRAASLTRTETVAEGPVESWVELLDVSLPFVSFRWTYRFLASREVITSDSTLRFRTRPEVESSLRDRDRDRGFGSLEIGDAPDRPGKEFVFVATAL